MLVLGPEIHFRTEAPVSRGSRRRFSDRRFAPALRRKRGDERTRGLPALTRGTRVACLDARFEERRRIGHRPWRGKAQSRGRWRLERLPRVRRRSRRARFRAPARRLASASGIHRSLRVGVVRVRVQGVRPRRRPRGSLRRCPRVRARQVRDASLSSRPPNPSPSRDFRSPARQLGLTETRPAPPPLAAASARRLARTCGCLGPARAIACSSPPAPTATRFAWRSPPPPPPVLPDSEILEPPGTRPKTQPAARGTRAHAAQIDLDVERTFPNHPDFRAPDKGAPGRHRREARTPPTRSHGASPRIGPTSDTRKG